jgi:hypothetical protein
MKVDMAKSVLDSLSGEEILESNSLGVVTNNWVVVRSPGESEIVISLSRVSTVKTIKTTYPGLLVVASAALLIAAAAASSKQGAGAALPIAFLGLLFAIGYLLSRRAAVSFTVGAETFRTPDGSLRDAAVFVAAIEKALVKLDRTGEPFSSG